MQRNPGVSATGSTGLVFDAEDGALGLVARAANGRDTIRVALDGIGDVWIDPVSCRGVARVDDWEAFCAAPAARLRVARGAAPPDGPQRTLADLLWTLGYHASAGRLPMGVNRHAVIRLAYWPNFSRLPCVPDMYRLCALLVRRPSSIHLAGRLVGVDDAQTFRFFTAAQACGVIGLVTRTNELSGGQDEETATAASPPLSETSVTSMLRQLWNKMTGR